MLRSFHARPVSNVIIIASLLVFTLMSDTFAAAPTKRVRILFADFSERMGLFFVAKDQHFFEEHGLEADLVQVNSGPVAVAAMAANEAEFYTVSATGSALGRTQDQQRLIDKQVIALTQGLDPARLSRTQQRLAESSRLNEAANLDAEEKEAKKIQAQLVELLKTLNSNKNLNILIDDQSGRTSNGGTSGNVNARYK